VSKRGTPLKIGYSVLSSVKMVADKRRHVPHYNKRWQQAS